MYFTAFLLSLIGISCAAGACLCFGKCLRWCGEERWQQPLAGDRFVDGRE
jgi:hypothetical protein